MKDLTPITITGTFTIHTDIATLAAQLTDPTDPDDLDRALSGIGGLDRTATLTIDQKSIDRIHTLITETDAINIDRWLRAERHQRRQARIDHPQVPDLMQVLMDSLAAAKAARNDGSKDPPPEHHPFDRWLRGPQPHPDHP